MRNRKLNQREIDSINLFVNSVSDIDIVEGIYIVPYVDITSRKQGARIVTIYNTNPDYLLKLNGNNSELAIIDYNNLHSTIANYNGFFQSTSSLSFFANDTKNYSTNGPFSHANKMSLQSLTSGTILFDRFGDIEKTRFKALEYVEPFKQAVLLKNIDEIVSKNETIQYQKKPNN